MPRISGAFKLLPFLSGRAAVLFFEFADKKLVIFFKAVMICNTADRKICIDDVVISMFKSNGINVIHKSHAHVSFKKP